MSEKVYDITTGDRVPINILPGSFNIKKSNDYKYFLRFKAISAYEDQVFTPTSLPSLGA